MPDHKETTFQSELVVLTSTEWTSKVPYDLHDRPIALVTNSRRRGFPSWGRARGLWSRATEPSAGGAADP
jgi:hypothetical protein